MKTKNGLRLNTINISITPSFPMVWCPSRLERRGGYALDLWMLAKKISGWSIKTSGRTLRRGRCTIKRIIKKSSSNRSLPAQRCSWSSRKIFLRSRSKTRICSSMWSSPSCARTFGKFFIRPFSRSLSSSFSRYSKQGTTTWVSALFFCCNLIFWLSTLTTTLALF